MMAHRNAFKLLELLPEFSGQALWKKVQTLQKHSSLSILSYMLKTKVKIKN